MHLALRLPDVVRCVFEFLDSSQDVRRAVLVCRGWHDLIAPSMLRRKLLGDLAALLPEALIVADGLDAMRHYMGSAFQTDETPTELFAVVPFSHCKNLSLSDRPPRDSHEDRYKDPLNCMNFPPDYIAEAPRGEHYSACNFMPYHFLQIFRRVPTESDLVDLLRESTNCTRLLYSAQDSKAFLAIHTLERLFPMVNFFPKLTELVLIGHGGTSRSEVSIPVPFSLIRRASTIIFDDAQTGTRGPDGEIQWSSGGYDIINRVSDLPSNTFVSLRSIRRVTRWVPAGDAPPGVLPQYMDVGFNSELSLLRTIRNHPSNTFRSLSLPGVPHSWDARVHEDVKELTLGQDLDLPLPDIQDSPQRMNVVPFNIGAPSQAPPPCHLERLTARGYSVCQRLPRLLEKTPLPDLEYLTIEAPRVRIDPGLTMKMLKVIGEKMTGLKHLHLDLALSVPPVLSARLNSDSTRPFEVEESETGMEKFDVINLLPQLTVLEHLHIILPPSGTSPPPPSTPSTSSTSSLAPSSPTSTPTPTNEIKTGLRLVPLSEEDLLHEIPTIWPALTHLVLDPLGFPRSTNALSFDSVVNFAQLMPNIEVLGLGLDMRPEMVHAVYSSKIYRFHGGPPPALKELNLGLPVFQNSSAVVDTLHELFPSLRHLIVPSVPSSIPSAPRVVPTSSSIPTFDSDTTTSAQGVEDQLRATGRYTDPGMADEGRAFGLRKMAELLMDRIAEYIPPSVHTTNTISIDRDGGEVISTTTGVGGGWSWRKILNSSSNSRKRSAARAGLVYAPDPAASAEAGEDEDEDVLISRLRAQDREAPAAGQGARDVVEYVIDEEEAGYFYDSQEDEGELESSSEDGISE